MYLLLQAGLINFVELLSFCKNVTLECVQIDDNRTREIGDLPKKEKRKN